MPVGEIDLVALKGRRLAFVEVKQRRDHWRRRLGAADARAPSHYRAAQYWLSIHPGFAGYDLAFDVVLAAPWAWPRYIANAFPV
jgi:putative endonuclease